MNDTIVVHSYSILYITYTIWRYILNNLTQRAVSFTYSFVSPFHGHSHGGYKIVANQIIIRLANHKQVSKRMQNAVTTHTTQSV